MEQLPTNSVLIIDDEVNMLDMLSASLRREGFQIAVARDGTQGLEYATAKVFDYILCDLKMPVMNGLEFLEKAKARKINSTIIMMSAFATVDLAVKAMKSGAYDFVTKPFKIDQILCVLEKAAERTELKENIHLRQKIQELEKGLGFEAMIGESKVLQDVISLAKRVAGHDTTVLITGESGTGKELVARGIHQFSNRCDGPFVTINCGAIPANLLESEFFGYVKGAFTGAESDRQGLFEAAEGGTLLLDEIGELPQELQVKLLRVLQESEVKPVGAHRSLKVNVRIIAATAKDLESAVLEGIFRKDLFYRLNVVSFQLPPLRERIEDISGLSEKFVKKSNEKNGLKIKGVSRDAIHLLMRHNWPGNVRELENAIERAAIFCDSYILGTKDFSFSTQKHEGTDELVELLGTLSLKKAQKILEGRFIASAMELVDGNKSKASEMLEISYPSLLSKIKEYKED